jgi:hypothetical protein
MSRNSPDAAETIIHVMEGMATQSGLRGGDTLRDLVRNRVENRERTSQPTQQPDKREENSKKKVTKELNTALAELLPLEELWEVLSNSLCKFY